MKFLSWMHHKLGGNKQDNRFPNTYYSSTYNYYRAKQEPREEFSDWPHGLLAIGTFGNKNEIKANPETQSPHGEDDPSSSSEEISDFSPEEIGKLQKELTKLLTRKPNVEKEIAELPLDRFLNCPSSLEIDRRISNALCSDSDDKEEDIEKTLSVIIGKCQDIWKDNINTKKAIGKKPISFLLKKMFACRSGFAPPPNPRDILQESKMEKILRTILHKKLYSQTSRSPSMKWCLEDNKTPKKRNEEETEERTDDGCKWVKTDSEYIVLEI